MFCTMSDCVSSRGEGWLMNFGTQMSAGKDAGGPRASHGQNSHFQTTQDNEQLT